VNIVYGPHICGEAIDIRHDHSILTGSYRIDDVLQLYDIRTLKCVKSLNWDGGYKDPLSEAELKNLSTEVPASPTKKKPGPAPFLYSALFSRPDGDLILGGGAGNNEVRVFDFASGKLLASISDMEKSVLAMDYANSNPRFAFGGSDSCLRIMNIIEAKPKEAGEKKE